MKKDIYVPDVLIFGILRSLPAKSLVRFKSVCKSWLSFITQLRYDNEEFILRTSVFFHSIDFKASQIKQVMLGIPPRKSLSTVIGSCNGLLCVQNSKDVLCIWNPWTRRYKTVPSSETNGSGIVNLFGFGYDHSTDDYIIVRCVLKYRCTIVEIYSRKTDSWFQMGKLPRQIMSFSIVCNKQMGFFVNGALYWHVKYVDNNYDYVSDSILCFDLVDRKFSMIVPPDDYDKEHDLFDLGVLGGRFCVINYDHDCHSDIWALEGNNKKGPNWIKLMSIPSINYKHLPAPVFLMKNGEVVLRIINEYYIMDSYRRNGYAISSNPKDENKLFIYNQKHKTLRELTIPCNALLSHKEITYTRSTVSPASDAGDDHESPFCYEAETTLLCRNLDDVDIAVQERMVELQQYSTTTTTGEYKQEFKPEICGHLLSEFGPHCKSSATQVSLQWTIELDPM